jgi:hypothetical protein
VLGGAFKVVGEIAGGIINVIGAVISGLNSLISAAVAGINALIRLYNSVPFLPNVSEISAPSISVPKVTIPKTATTASTVPTITVPGTTTTTGTTSTTKASSGVSSAVAGAAGILTSPFNVGSFRAAEAATMGTTINLTVNGAFDKEGTARTIVNTLNDSFYRGTGGGTNLQMA